MVDKITVEVIKNAAIYASEEMGIVLRNTAYSPNIKDRLDHSCAVLTPDGRLVAQAEHIPVHIGSMSVGAFNTLRYLEEEGEVLREGDVVVVNDPYIAGTHLNDITMIKPVYVDGDIVALVANKAHHVDVGGSVPGSLGGDVRELIQEGIVIPPTKIMEKNELKKDVVRLLESNVRTPHYLRGDLKAQIAALNVGEKRILELARKYGVKTLLEAWEDIIDYTSRYTTSILEELGVEGSYIFEDYMEWEEELINIKLKLDIKKNNIIADYTGTHRQVDAPINAVYGVTVAATTYALKSVLDPEMPINYGFLEVVDIRVPLGTLLNPKKPAPVSGGNVETSQRIADVVLGALAKALPDRVPAAAAGTMNNIAIGGRGWAFYETIGGGMGGRPGKDGVDAIHVHMTNTLNTPIEVLETEYPIRFLEYSIRPASGGPGKYRGGNGMRRIFKVLEDGVTLTVTGERKKTRPWGLRGGKPGTPARYAVIKNDGRVIELPSKARILLEVGDTVVIETPGGGGYGDPCERPRELVEKDLREGRITLEQAVREYCYNP